MKKPFYTLIFTFAILSTYGQVSDTTKVQPATVAPAEPSIQKVDPVEPAQVVQPRIIYYEDSRPTTESYRYDKRRQQSDIKTLSGNMHHSGGFFGISFRTSDFRGEASVLGGIRTGWIVNRTVGIGVEGHGIIPTAKFDDIDTERTVVLLGGYGGMFMEFIAFSNQVVHVTFPVSAGAGWLGYNDDWENDFNNPQPQGSVGLIDEDVFWYVEPGASLELNVSKSFRMSFGVSKRFTQDLDLMQTDPSDFQNINFFVTLKMGRF